jgi:hypothetical protein
MNRPATKAQLLEGIRVERQRLEDSLAGLAPADMVRSPRPGAWSVKDILAHVSAWEDIFMGWYEAGLKGGKVGKPDFSQAGVLAEVNRQIYEANKDRSLKDVLAGFKNSYERILALVASIPEEDIFTRGKFAWTGTQKLVSYITSNTSSHYPMHLRMIETLKRKFGISNINA